MPNMILINKITLNNVYNQSYNCYFEDEFALNSNNNLISYCQKL